MNVCFENAEMEALRMPGEWEPHRATHLAWPVNRADWPGKFVAAGWAYAEFVRHLSNVESIVLVVRDEGHERRVRRMLGEVGARLDGIQFMRRPLDRGWMRDISPFFAVDRRRRLVGIHFQFTGWAKYKNHGLDAQWPAYVASERSIPLLAATHRGQPVVLEGGAVDFNGQGTVMTTEECLLDATCQPRNKAFSKRDYEDCFRRHLGATNCIWLGAGIAGDDTHGHVDDVCRFVSPGTVVLCREKNTHDANYRVLEENRERLESARLETGSSPEVVFLPMPDPLYFRGIRLPASYANFYIANGIVLMPTFNDEQDRVALGILGELFPDRRVIGIHAVDLVWGFGTLHCLSHEEPEVLVPNHG